MDSHPERSQHPMEPPSNQPVHPLERRPPLTPPRTSETENRTRRIEVPHSEPTYTYIILVVNIAVFLIDYALSGMLTQLGAKENLLIVSGQYWRFITPMFLHALPPPPSILASHPEGIVALLHIGFNSYFLYMMGPQVERAFGHLRFLAIYFLSGFAASLLSFMLSPYPSVGASGALFGLIGALFPLAYRNRAVIAGTRARIGSIVRVILINLVIGFSVRGIDNWAHIGGLIGGLTLAWFITPRYAVRYDVAGVPERVEDTTLSQLAWFWFTLMSVALLGISFIVIQFKR